MPEDEKWLPIPGHALLEASSRGRVRSIPYETPMPNGGVKINQMQPTFGCVSKSSKTAMHPRINLLFRRKNYRVARLVCLAFHGEPPPGKPYALHKNEDALDNRPSNLEWGSQKQNFKAPKISAYVNSGPPGERVYPD